MQRLSISGAWEAGWQLFVRERAILVPAALLFIGMPSLISQLVQPVVPTGQTPPAGPWLFVVLAMAAVSLWGSLVIYALCLHPGQTLRDAMRRATARAPVALGALVLAGVAGGLLVGIVAGLVLATGSKALSSAATLLLAMLAMWVGVRLTWFIAVLVAEQAGIVDSWRRAWALTRGHFLPLLGFVLVISLILFVLILASQAIGGVVGTVAGLALDRPGLGRFGADLVSAAVTAVGGAVLAPVVCALYRQVTATR